MDWLVRVPFIKERGQFGKLLNAALIKAGFKRCFIQLASRGSLYVGSVFLQGETCTSHAWMSNFIHVLVHGLYNLRILNFKLRWLIIIVVMAYRARHYSLISLRLIGISLLRFSFISLISLGFGLIGWASGSNLFAGLLYVFRWRCPFSQRSLIFILNRV